MEPDSPESFDDPALKAAVRRVWRAEQTPLELRQRIAAAGQPRRSASPAPTPRTRFRGVPFRLAAAAVLILGIGLIAFHLIGPRPAQSSPNSLPASLASDLVFRHDRCCQAPDHHMPGLPRQDFARIASDLKWRVGVTVLSGPLKGNNLVFEGASLCPVGKIDSAHLLYKGADQEAVSVFSLPASVVPAGVNDASYETVAAGHPISGFVHDGGFYCVVGSGPSPLVSLDQIRGLLGQLKPQFVVPRATVALAAP